MLGPHGVMVDVTRCGGTRTAGRVTEAADRPENLATNGDDLLSLKLPYNFDILQTCNHATKIVVCQSGEKQLRNENEKGTMGCGSGIGLTCGYGLGMCGKRNGETQNMLLCGPRDTSSLFQGHSLRGATV